ncbi:hypothetical protein Peur_056064 [Populus x canadensis]
MLENHSFKLHQCKWWLLMSRQTVCRGIYPSAQTMFIMIEYRRIGLRIHGSKEEHAPMSSIIVCCHSAQKGLKSLAGLDNLSAIYRHSYEFMDVCRNPKLDFVSKLFGELFIFKSKLLDVYYQELFLEFQRHFEFMNLVGSTIYFLLSCFFV